MWDWQQFYAHEHLVVHIPNYVKLTASGLGVPSWPKTDFIAEVAEAIFCLNWKEFTQSRTKVDYRVEPDQEYFNYEYMITRQLEEKGIPKPSVSCRKKVAVQLRTINQNATFIKEEKF